MVKQEEKEYLCAQKTKGRPAKKKKTEDVEVTSFILDLLWIGSNSIASKVEKYKQEKKIIIYLEYRYPRYQKDGEAYSIYDKAPEREWQHLNWFEYKCLIKCSLPRYIKDGKVITAEVDFVPQKNIIR